MNTTKKPSFSIALRIWWAYIWRSLLVTIVFYSLFSTIVEQLFDGSLSQYSLTFFNNRSYLVTDLIALVVNLFLSIYLWKFILDKKYGSHRLQFHPKAKLPQNKPTFWMLTRIWWLFLWRSIVAAIIIALFQTFITILLAQLFGDNIFSIEEAYDSFLRFSLFSFFATIISFVVYAIATIYIVRDLVLHQYKDFILKLTKINI